MTGMQISLGAFVVVGLVGVALQGSELDRGPIKFSTTLQGRSDNQRHNAFLACSKLNGAVIQPGDEFSFNRRVGSWSRDAGYRRAPVSYNGTLIDAWGGGVCQTSTTLYNAALIAGLEILERHPHRFAPSYCPPGRDAAVAFSGVDLRFRNTYDFPVTISARFEGDQLVVGLAGKGQLSRSAVATDVRKFSAPMEHRVDLGGGKVRVRTDGKPGWEVVTYRVSNGKREWIASDSYPTMDRVIEFR